VPYKLKKRRKHNNLNEDQANQIKYDAEEAYQQGEHNNPYPKYSEAWEIWDDRWRKAQAYFED
jgi:hypothetical protein